MKTEDQDLRIREQLLSLHSLNPFIAAASSPRGLMFGAHLSQCVTIEHGEPQIIQTGVDVQLADNTFSCGVKNESVVLAILKRYNGVSAGSVCETAEYLVVVQDVVTNELDAVSIPTFHKLHQYFGFRYKLDENTLNAALIGTIIPAGATFADSPTVVKDTDGDKVYNFGVPVNLAYLSIPEVTGDGVIISESLAEKFTFRTYETVSMEFGEHSFPLNLYGDDEHYKPFPDIGEKVNDDRVVIATREYNTELSPALISRQDVKDYSVYFDKPYYVKSTGGVLVDIKAYHSEKSRKSTYTETTDQADKYVRALKQFYQDVVNVYTEQQKNNYRCYGKEAPVTPRFHRMLIDAYASCEKTRKIRYTHTNDLVDLYRLEFTIEFKTIPEIGFKVN
jgi:hypothetical protein